MRVEVRSPVWFRRLFPGMYQVLPLITWGLLGEYVAMDIPVLE